ncbi:MAG TPA: hypothetical protein VGW78_02585 [Candidatus Babeliales bacterium]|jgi:hypothetical protein|nr:hypothetical protein [Candidatus Babeliales bacterium]
MTFKRFALLLCIGVCTVYIIHASDTLLPQAQKAYPIKKYIKLAKHLMILLRLNKYPYFSGEEINQATINTQNHTIVMHVDYGGFLEKIKIINKNNNQTFILNPDSHKELFDECKDWHMNHYTFFDSARFILNYWFVALKNGGYYKSEYCAVDGNTLRGINVTEVYYNTVPWRFTVIKDPLIKDPKFHKNEKLGKSSLALMNHLVRRQLHENIDFRTMQAQSFAQCIKQKHANALSQAKPYETIEVTSPQGTSLQFTYAESTITSFTIQKNGKKATYTKNTHTELLQELNKEFCIPSGKIVSFYAEKSKK